MAKAVVLLGDSSDHGGTVISSGTSKIIVEGKAVVVDGALHSCPLDGHGVTPITGNSAVLAEGKKIVVTGATAGCGAKITGSCVKFFVC